MLKVRIKRTWFIIFFILIASCVNTKTSNESKDFSFIIGRFFGNYVPLEKVWVNKPESKYSITYIDKKNLSMSEFNNIRHKLKKAGWREISNQDNYYEYCLGEKMYMGVLYPIHKKHFNSKGLEVKYTNIDNWLIGLSFGEGGVDYCKNDVEKIKLE